MQNYFERARALFLDAVKLRSCWFGEGHPAVADVLNDLADLLSNSRNKHGLDLQEAEKLYRTALEIRERCYGPGHILVANTLFNLSTS